MQIEIKDTTFKFLQDLVHEIDAQDNRSTAKPYFYIIQEPRWRVCHENFDFGDTKTVYVDPEEHSIQYDSPEEYIETLINSEGIEPEKAQTMAKDLLAYKLERYWEESNVFFTQKGYEEHLALNRHNLREPESYVKHAFRNPEIAGLLKAIMEIVKTNEHHVERL